MESRTRTVGIIQPAPPEERGGNRVTALRWAKLLRQLGRQVFVERAWSRRECDVLIALHARKSLDSIRRFRAARPQGDLIVAGTGTDLYVDLARGGLDGERAREGFSLADRIVLLQASAIERLPAELRSRACVVHQSTPLLEKRPAPLEGEFEVCVLSNLRAVKDPLLAARAASRLPASSRVRVTHLGASVDAEIERDARERSASDPRYHWLGSVKRREALCTLARSRLLVSSSLAEGGANVLTEAFACGVPVLATRIDGATGLLGEDHPGLFPAGDEVALARLLERAERDADFLGELERRSLELARLSDPARELEAWSRVLDG